MVKMTFIFRAASLGAVFLALTTVGRADDGDAHGLVQRVRDSVPTAPFVAKAKMTSDRGWTRELELSHKHLNNDVDASYMEVTAPMDLKDTRFLVFDHKVGRDEQWIFVPQAKRSIQVGSQTRKQAFLGSEFYVGDFVQPDLDAFTYRFVGEDTIGGRHCKLVEVVPKNPADEMYSKSILAIDPADVVIVRTQFFDEQGKALKVWTIDKLEKIESVWTPVQQKMDNVQENHWSKLELSEIKYNVELPDETFNKSHLTR